MMSVPGIKPGISDALVEQVDVFPTIVAAATLHLPGGPEVVPHCPGNTQASRGTPLCTEGVSLLPLLKDPVGTPWPRAAFSQFVRDGRCCDCAKGKEKKGDPCCE